MNPFNFLLILLFSTTIIISLVNSTVIIQSKEWEEFKLQHQKHYNSPTEEKARFMIFQENLIKILEHNKKFQRGLVSYKMGVNKFADLTPNEFNGILNMNKVSRRKARSANQLFRRPLNVDLPKEINWSEMGAVTPIKDQGYCGSCWSFSATGALEGQYYLKNKKLISLSEQNLIDCSTNYGNYGCNGGLMDSAFQYVHDHGITTEESYPYEAKDDVCRSNKSINILSITGFTDIKEGSEEDLMAAIATVGPVSVAIDATNLHLYSSGIFNDLKCSETELNHGVLAVGYGSEDGADYWLVKNSWGVEFGEKGYLKMARNKGNQCGIATLASYPNL